VIILNELLVWEKDKMPVSTVNMTGKSALTGIPIGVPDLGAYAIDCNGNMYIHEHISPESHEHKKTGEFFTHSSFFTGQQGLCFGMLSVRDGKIIYLDHESGHYLPTEQHFRHAQDLLALCFDEKIEIRYISASTSSSVASSPKYNQSHFFPIQKLARIPSTASMSSNTSENTFVDHGSPPPEIRQS